MLNPCMYLLKPDLNKNENYLDRKRKKKNLDYAAKLILGLKIKKLWPKGRGPEARALHCACAFKNYIAIFGGRNDGGFLDKGMADD